MNDVDEAFEEWWDSYEADGGELLLFNAYDLAAAFKAGAEWIKKAPSE